MSTVRDPVPPTQAAYEEAVRKLREHLDDAEAETLARRYLEADKTSGKPLDIPALKQRLLKRMP